MSGGPISFTENERRKVIAIYCGRILAENGVACLKDTSCFLGNKKAIIEEWERGVNVLGILNIGFTNGHLVSLPIPQPSSISEATKGWD